MFSLWIPPHKHSLTAVAIRSFRLNNPQSLYSLFSALTTRIDCFPVVAGIWEQQRTSKKRLIVWKFEPPPSPFAALELLEPPSCLGEGQEGWGESLIERALRTHASQETWEPLLNSLTTPQKQLHRLIELAIVEAREDFLAFLFQQRPVLDERLLQDHLTQAIQLGRVQCAIELIKAKGCQPLHKFLETEPLNRWPPLTTAFNAIIEERWEMALPLLTAFDISDSLSPTLYKHLLAFLQTLPNSSFKEEQGKILRDFLEDLLKIEPRITNSLPAIALAAQLGDQ